MAVNTDVTILLDSSRCGKRIELLRFTEFDIDMDLETDADAFDFVAKNPNGVYTALFSKFDKCIVKVNDIDLMSGNVDSITYIYTDEDNYIKISGRDLCWKLVDNDALPDTIQNIQTNQYIAQKCAEYGINYISVGEDSIYPKLVIGCGESEISIIDNLLLENRQRAWFINNTLYSGDWDTGASPRYTFVRSSFKSGIPIKRIELIEDGTDMRSEMLIYGSDSSGLQKVMGSAKNIMMNALGIIKRKVRRHYSDSASTKYTSIADKDIRDNFRDNIILRIDVKIDDIYIPNTTARVVIDKLGIDSVFFIKSVKYSKTIDSGSKASLTLIPADSEFEKLWQSSSNISVTNYTEESSKIAR